jgi:hypothetical protein
MNQKARAMVMDNIFDGGNNLNPAQMIGIVERAYGKRADRMKPTTLARICCDLYQHVADVDRSIIAEIDGSVEAWLNS